MRKAVRFHSLRLNLVLALLLLSTQHSAPQHSAPQHSAEEDEVEALSLCPLGQCHLYEGRNATLLMETLGNPEAGLIQSFRRTYGACNMEQRAQSVQEELFHKISADDEHFFAVLANGEWDESDVTEVASRDLVIEIDTMDQTGEAYETLEEVSAEARLSTDLWAGFSRNAVETFREHSPRNFLQPSVSPWIHQGMFSAWPYTFGLQLAAMFTSPNWDELWKDLIQESPIGNPPMCDMKDAPEFGNTWAPQTSGNLVHQAFHTLVFELVAGAHIWETSDIILEFGGGYGCLCNHIHSAGFKGRYILYDLPVFSVVQGFYLQSHGRPVYSLSSNTEAFLSGQPGVYTTSDPELVNQILTSSDCTGSESPGRLCVRDARATFIAMWSLAEAPDEARAPFKVLIPRFDSVLLGYRDSWGGLDNDKLVLEAEKEAKASKVGQQVISTVLHLPREISALDRYFVLHSHQPQVLRD